MSEYHNPRLSSEAIERIEQGAQRGRETTSAAFAGPITRRRFCELVRIHRTTLIKRWEPVGVVSPKLQAIRGIDTWVFNADDVAVGKRVVDILQQHPGQMSAAQAGAQARSELGLP